MPTREYKDDDADNMDNLPPGPKFKYVDEPDTSTPGIKNPTIKVTYSNGHVVEVPVEFTVTGNVVEQTDSDTKPSVPATYVKVTITVTKEKVSTPVDNPTQGHNDENGNTIVEVSEGLEPGTEIEVVVPNGSTIDPVPVPEDAKPGDKITITIPTTPEDGTEVEVITKEPNKLPSEPQKVTLDTAGPTLDEEGCHIKLYEVLYIVALYVTIMIEILKLILKIIELLYNKD